MGGYELEGSNLALTQMASTMMACSDGMVTEQAFLAALAKVRRWKIIGEHLELFDASGNQIAHFESRYLR